MNVGLSYFWLLHCSSLFTHKQEGGKQILNWNSLQLKKVACCYGEIEARLTKQTFSEGLCWFLNGLYSIIPSLHAGIIFQGFLSSFSRTRKIRFLIEYCREEESGKQAVLFTKSRSLSLLVDSGEIRKFPSFTFKNQKVKMGKWNTFIQSLSHECHFCVWMCVAFRGRVSL